MHSPFLRRRSRRRRSRGQSLAEFALVFPILMLIVGAIIQFGIIFWGLNTLNQVVRDTGRWAATQQTACTDPLAVTNVITTANSIAANSSLIGFTAGSILPAEIAVGYRSVPLSGPCPPNTNQEEAWVTITIQHDVPVFFPFVPGDGHITSSTEFRMEPKPK